MGNKKEKIIKLRQAGMTFREIGEILGVSKQRVYQILSAKHKELYCIVCNKKLSTGDGKKYCLNCHIKGKKTA